MASLHSIFQDIALIISGDSDVEGLRLKLETEVFDWEQIVPVASGHLVIPLIYCKLKEKAVLHLLPEDLKSYLNEISRQNRERNNTILNEVLEISSLLHENNIDHVFLKGAALLVSGIYGDITERMVGDIDILVHPDQLSSAQNLLLVNGYKDVETTLGHNFFEHKHLPRLIPDTKLAAVEIHRKLLYTNIEEELDPITILSQKQDVNGVYIPGYKDLLVHVVLNFEINDYGYYYSYLGLRNTYDVILLIKKVSNEDLIDLANKKYFISFFQKTQIYFSVLEIKSERRFLNYRRNLFLVKQKSKWIAVTSIKILNLIQFGGVLANRFLLYIKNSKYRKEILNDRKRILNLIKGKINSF